jgi:hypothetical protein
MLIGYGLYRLRKRQLTPRSPKGAREQNTFALRRAAALYRLLEGALATRGVPRPLGAPPLAHAQALFEVGHPTGPEALRLTKRYLRARFGDEAFTADEAAAFERSVRELRQSKRTSAVAA